MLHKYNVGRALSRIISYLVCARGAAGVIERLVASRHAAGDRATARSSARGLLDTETGGNPKLC